MADAVIPTMTKVKSSNIDEVGHDGQALYVRFRSAKPDVPGKLYRYPTCGTDHHEALLNANSIGTHFRDNIRDAHTGEPVTE